MTRPPAVNRPDSSFPRKPKPRRLTTIIPCSVETENLAETPLTVNGPYRLFSQLSHSRVPTGFPPVTSACRLTNRSLRFRLTTGTPCEPDGTASSSETGDVHSLEHGSIRSSPRPARPLNKIFLGGRQPPSQAPLFPLIRRGSSGTQWSRTDSNRRPPACKAGALPTELRPLSCCRTGAPASRQVGARRFELRTSSLSATRSNQLSYAPITGDILRSIGRLSNGDEQFLDACDFPQPTPPWRSTTLPPRQWSSPGSAPSKKCSLR